MLLMLTPDQVQRKKLCRYFKIKRESGTNPCFRGHVEMTGFHQQCLEHVVTELEKLDALAIIRFSLGLLWIPAEANTFIRQYFVHIFSCKYL